VDIPFPTYTHRVYNKEHFTHPFQQQQTNDVADIIIDQGPAPMEVEELPNVHDCE
jgi:hypothetical protein